jgi:hypothetical protein
MPIELFKKDYSSESIVDMFRDVHECFDSRFNEPAKHLGEEFTVNVAFVFEDENKNDKQVLLDKNYDNESMIDVEEDLTDSFKNIKVEQDEYGFFEGDLIVKITII